LTELKSAAAQTDFFTRGRVRDAVRVRVRAYAFRLRACVRACALPRLPRANVRGAGRRGRGRAYV